MVPRLASSLLRNSRAISESRPSDSIGRSGSIGSVERSTARISPAIAVARRPGRSAASQASNSARIAPPPRRSLVVRSCNFANSEEPAAEGKDWNHCRASRLNTPVRARSAASASCIAASPCSTVIIATPRSAKNWARPTSAHGPQLIPTAGSPSERR